jgi:predicted permease
MALVLQILEIIAPVFMLAFVGWSWVRTGHRYEIEFVTRLVMNISAPCLVFTALVKVEIDPTAFRDLALAAVSAYALVGVLIASICLVAGLSYRTYLAPLTFGNTGNMGLPLALYAFGELGLAYAVVVFAVMVLLSFTLGVWVVTGRSNPTEALRQPLFYAAILGSAIGLLDVPVPKVVINAMSLAGQMMIPMMLITLGVSISRLNVNHVWRASMLSVLKAGVCALAGFGAAHVFGLTDAARGVLVLQLLTPVAVTSYLLAERYNADAEAVSGLVVVSTLLTLAVVPAALSVLL